MSTPAKFCAALAFGLGLATLAAAPVRNGAVAVDLVSAAAGVEPGHTLQVALRMQHDPGWHSYWIYPGTGYPTTIQWTLPPGWKAGSIHWPVPKVLRDANGTIVGNGYDGTDYFFIDLTPPADLQPGTSVTLKAAVDWLMCQNECMPGDANVSLTLPVVNGPPPADPAWAPRLKKALGQLPHPPAGWQFEAGHTPKSVTFTFRPPTGSHFQPADFHFFADDGLIAYDQPQTVRAGKDGTYTMHLAVDPSGPKNPTHLVGVLALASGGVPGIRIDVPFGGTNRALAAAGGAAMAATGSRAGFAGTLVLAFLGGLILNLMPCVFPVLGIKILGFVHQAGAERRKVSLHGVVFTIGVVLSFWVLAGILIALRAGGRELGWGFQLQEPGFVYVLALLMMIFALNLSGVFEVGLSAVGLGARLQAKSGLTGSFFTGVLATAVATPCSAPFVGPALGAALALSGGESIVVFTFIALGLSVPYLLLSIFPGALKFLPKPGEWMEGFKQLMAFLLYATVGFLVWVLAGQTSDTGLLKVLFSLVLVAMAAWIYGRWTQHRGKAWRRPLGYVFAAALLIAGTTFGYPRRPDLTWQPWSPATVTQLQSEGKVVYVDFTARWCATCQSNKAVVFSSKKVLTELHKHGVVLLRADWTNKDPRITEALASFGRSAVPFDLIYAPGHAQPIILPELLTPDIVLRALKKATADS